MRKSKKTQYQAQPFESSQNGHDRYMRLYESMFSSDAWRSLSHASRTVYLIIRNQYKGNFTGNTLICPYSVFQKYGMNNTTIKKCISELERKGFIEVKSGTRQCTSKNLHRTPNEYTLIGKWKDYVPSESEKRIIGKKSDAENKTHAHY